MGDYNRESFPTKQPVITAGAYSAGDVIGGLMEFTLEKANTPGFTLRQILIGDAANVKAPMTLWFFSDRPATVINDNDPFSSISDADIRDKCLGWATVAAGDYKTAGANAFGQPAAVNKGLKTDAAYKFYVYAVCDTGPTFGAATDLRFTFEVWLDG